MKNETIRIMDEERMQDVAEKWREDFRKKTGFSGFFDEIEKVIISGDFVEGEEVTVRIDGKEYTRKVRYSGKYYADLYIMVKGYAFTYSEFTRAEEIEAEKEMLLNSVFIEVEISESKLPLNQIIETIEGAYKGFRFNRTESRYDSCIIATFEKVG